MTAYEKSNDYALQKGSVKQHLRDGESVYESVRCTSASLRLYFLFHFSPKGLRHPFLIGILMAFANVCVTSCVSAEMSKAFLCTPEHFALWTKHHYVCGVNISMFLVLWWVVALCLRK